MKDILHLGASMYAVLDCYCLSHLKLSLQVFAQEVGIGSLFCPHSQHLAVIGIWSVLASHLFNNACLSLKSYSLNSNNDTCLPFRIVRRIKDIIC